MKRMFNFGVEIKVVLMDLDDIGNFLICVVNYCDYSVEGVDIIVMVILDFEKVVCLVFFEGNIIYSMLFVLLQSIVDEEKKKVLLKCF